MARLRRVDPEAPGWGRRRSGRGFVYLDERGNPITDTTVKQRCRELVIPPAWQQVWICPQDNGHIQATGIDDAGRRQYLYHPQWRAAQDALKHDRVLQVAARLPAARRRTRADLPGPGMPRNRALAVAFTLLDRGLFRLGTEAYTREHGSFGLATLRKEHLRITRSGDAVFDYPAKGGARHHFRMTPEADLRAALTMLRRRRGGGSGLLAYRDGGRQGPWREVTSAEISEHVKDLLGAQATVKDFRTWHATVLAAVALAPGAAEHDQAEQVDQQRAVNEAVGLVAEHLGNTPAVSRSSYIDPRVIEAFHTGEDLPVSASPALAGSPEDADDDVARVALPAPPRVERQVRRLLQDG